MARDLCYNPFNQRKSSLWDFPKRLKKDRPLNPLANGHSNQYSDSNGSRFYYEDSSLLDDKELLRILLQVRNGNFTVRMPIGEVGVKGRIYDTLNEIISLNEEMMREFTKAGNTIGKQGKLTQRIEVPNAKGSWATGVGSLNSLISDLVHPTIEIAHVISSVAKGNLSQNMPTGDRRPYASGRVLPHRPGSKRHGETAQPLLHGGDPCGPGSGLRREAGRPGESQRSGRGLEGPDRLRQPHGG